MTALDAEPPKPPGPTPASSPPSAWADASVRDRWVFGLSAAALLALWLFAHPYAGIIHDARLYVGRALAELVAHGRYRTLDLTPLAHARIAAGERMFERIQY